MGLVITAESPIGKELAKWNKPYSYQPFPRMLYRAERPMNPKTMQREGPAEATDQVIVNSQTEQDNMVSRGYCLHPVEAIAALEKKENEVSDLTAARHYEDRKLSEKAQREALAADRSTDQHLPELVELPVRKKKPGRPKKVAAKTAVHEPSKVE